MKILRIVYDWPEPWAGLAPHPYELTDAQARLGHQITVFAGKWPNSGEILSPPEVEVVGFMREPLKGTISLTTSICMFFYYLKWRKSNKPDIIHTHGHFAIWIYLYRLFLLRFFKKSKELQIPLVAHFHNTVEGRKQKLIQAKKSISPISHYLSWPLAKKSDKWAVKAANACIFVSSGTKNEAVKYYHLEESKAFVVESGVNDAMFKPVGEEEKAKTRKDLGLDPMDIVVINYGMMVERKNILNLVQAMVHLPGNYKLLLVGSGDGDYLNKINQTIQDLKLIDRVLQVDYTPYPQIPIALQSADIFVLPSSWEGTPKVVMESLSCGLPVLASGFKLSEEIAGLNYLEDLSPETVARQIKQVIDSKQFVDRNKVYLLYSWDARARKIDEIYKIIFQNK